MEETWRGMAATKLRLRTTEYTEYTGKILAQGGMDSMDPKDQLVQITAEHSISSLAPMARAVAPKALRAGKRPLKYVT